MRTGKPGRSTGPSQHYLPHVSQPVPSTSHVLYLLQLDFLSILHRFFLPPEDFIMSLRAETRTGYHRARHTVNFQIVCHASRIHEHYKTLGIDFHITRGYPTVTHPIYVISKGHLRGSVTTQILQVFIGSFASDVPNRSRNFRHHRF
jgi:hypothetical protein